MAVLRGSTGGCIASLMMTVLLFSVIQCSSATQFVVGDSAGWSLSVNYTAWASKYTFRVGDSLLFNYRSDIHNVLSVTGSDYTACSSSNPVTTFKDGKSIISLTSAGSKYYICGTPGHCGIGQKLSIMVLAGESETPLSSPLSGGPTPGGIFHSPVKAPASGPSNSATSISSRSVLFAFMIGAIGAILNGSVLLSIV
ncbi:hypothetical protein O6H91_20G003800 [Diphasiastrum complanatum]|uniref:Uncharacterized protein n=3 Tax=Diphasiastrum complanatum TaxID=34168 RepID=A0ACC2AMA2_DIPCM|nr:hypothetical protein O6H91_20G003800 [Diphasiastrum complanatum]KAJ7518693.1 hypothetical protein O6H91_20G003800 [Diphasiastrum complanatum]KAJ7518694.1 hypothetical protein O6H91_20G003800 [Diphasiastrum complanatum]